MIHHPRIDRLKRHFELMALPQIQLRLHSAATGNMGSLRLRLQHDVVRKVILYIALCHQSYDNSD
jgi:hypothetical protein